MTYIIIIGIYQALCGLFFLLQLKKNKKSDSLLTYLIACIFIHLSIKLFLYNVLTTKTNNYDFVTFVDLAYCPLLYLYALKVRDDNYTLRKKWYLFLPASIAALAYLIIVFSLMVDYRSIFPVIELYNKIMQLLVLVFFIGFPLLIFNVIKETALFIKSERIFIRDIAALFLLIGTVCLLGLSFLYLSGSSGSIPFLSRCAVYGILILISFLILRFRFYAQANIKSILSKRLDVDKNAVIESNVISVEISETENNKTMEAANNMPPQKITRNAVLTEEQQNAVVGKLNILMEEKKVFTDNKLTLDRVASLAKIPKHHISEALNQYLGKTFYEYINDYRVNEVIVLMDKCIKQNIVPNILSLAYDAGFNSKSTFNQHFKRIQGGTPSEYLKMKAEISM